MLKVWLYLTSCLPGYYIHVWISFWWTDIVVIDISNDFVGLGFIDDKKIVGVHYWLCSVIDFCDEY